MAQYLFEIIRIGSSAKVTAIDPQTGTEAVVVTSANLTRYSMQQAATRKLKMLLEKQRKT